MHQTHFCKKGEIQLEILFEEVEYLDEVSKYGTGNTGAN